MFQFLNGLGRSRVRHYLSFQTFPLIIREILLGRREIVEGRVGATLWEQRGLVELEQILLHQPSHQVASIRLLAGPCMPLESVWIDQLKERLEVLLLAVVGSGGQKEEVARNC